MGSEGGDILYYKEYFLNRCNSQRILGMVTRNANSIKRVQLVTKGEVQSFARRKKNLGAVFIASAVEVRLRHLCFPHELLSHGGCDEYDSYIAYLLQKTETYPVTKEQKRCINKTTMGSSALSSKVLPKSSGQSAMKTILM
jgi:hypothetical protein